MNFDETFAQVAEAWLRVRLNCGWIEIRPDPTGRCDGPWLDCGDLTFLTAWNPGGRPADPDDNNCAQASLLDELENAGLVASTGSLIGADARWAHPAVVAAELSRGDAMLWARRFDQPVFVTWAEDGLVTTAADGTRSELTGWKSRFIEHRRCPMRPPIDGSDDPCKMHGGPYGSTAITAACTWAARRLSLLRAVGCDICDGGQPAATQGAPIILGAICDPAPGDTAVFVEPYRPADPPVRPW